MKRKYAYQQRKLEPWGGAEKLAGIRAEIALGSTVWIGTAYRATPVDAQTFARFERAGQDLFRVDSNNSLYIRRGKHWDCIDHCAFSVVRAHPSP